MKLKEYINNLTKELEKYPDLDVVYAIDSEGNRFHKVSFSPSIGHYNKNDFTQIENFEDYQLTEKDINAICIN